MGRFEVILSRGIKAAGQGRLPRMRLTLSQHGIMTIPDRKMVHPGLGITDQIPESCLYTIILAVSITRFHAAFLTGPAHP